MPIIPAKRRIYGATRPGWPFTLNRDSLQAEDLIGWWVFAPPFGSKVLDLSPHLSATRHDGTLINMDSGTDWITTAQIGGHALQFNGGTEHVLVPSGGPIGDLSSELTISAWWSDENPTDAVDGAIYSRADGFKDGLFYLYNNAKSGGGREARCLVNGTAFENVEAGTGANIKQDGIMHQSCMTYKANTTLKLYLDGIEINDFATSNTVASLPSDNTFIGAQEAAGTTHFVGVMGEVRVYGKAKNPSFIRELFEPPTRWELYHVRRKFYSFPPLDVRVTKIHQLEFAI